jgi:hypothetical protein
MEDRSRKIAWTGEDRPRMRLRKRAQITDGYQRGELASLIILSMTADMARTRLRRDDGTGEQQEADGPIFFPQEADDPIFIPKVLSTTRHIDLQTHTN